MPRPFSIRPAVVVLAGIALGLAALSLYAGSYDTPPATRTLKDRHGELIGTVNPLNGGRQEWTAFADIPPAVVTATLDAEDRFFFHHPGINPVAVVKAAVLNLTRGRIVRGGSTVTQQLAKLLREQRMGKTPRRTFIEKLITTALALGIELTHSKEWILERYLNTVFYGERCYGVAAAARHYFGKTLAELAPEEIALIVRLPRRPARARELVPPERRAGSLGFEAARHFSDALMRLHRDLDPVTATTLDLALQSRIEAGARGKFIELAERDPKVTAAVVVIEVANGDVLAMLGSRDYDDDAVAGNFNAALAPRQPGSALKPFTYFAAFAKGWGPETLVADEPVNFAAASADEAYMPQNFDRRFHGLVTVREALANSYNIPAVATLDRIGLSYYHDVLRRFGFSTFTKTPRHYGLAVTLGSGEVTLIELANAYAALARGGRFLPYRFALDEPVPASVPVADRAVTHSAAITAILMDPEARLKTFGFNDNLVVEGHEAAVKTGTSYELRDNWTVGYTARHAVGVWVGHADASPLNGSTGATGAAPLWHAVMEEVERGLPPARFGFLEGRRRKTGPETTLAEAVSPAPPAGGFRILTPLSGTRFRGPAFIPREHRAVTVEIEILASGLRRLTWSLDGVRRGERNLDGKEERVRFALEPEPGRHTLEVVSNAGESQRVRFEVRL